MALIQLYSWINNEEDILNLDFTTTHFTSHASNSLSQSGLYIEKYNVVYMQYLFNSNNTFGNETHGVRAVVELSPEIEIGETAVGCILTNTLALVINI